MKAEKLNHSFSIPLERIQDEIKRKIDPNFQDYDIIVPPKEITTVDSISLFNQDILEALIRRIPLRNSKIYPYEDSRILYTGQQPSRFQIGQTFVLKQKLISIMSELEDRLCSDFVSRPALSMPPFKIYGTNRQGDKVLAFYVPPILETHDDVTSLVDGIHRSYICKSAGAQIEALEISRVSAPLPFDPIDWRATRPVSEKPSIHERYVNIKKEYFRDLGAVGIDG
jgi:hypothetical protein